MVMSLLLATYSEVVGSLLLYNLHKFENSSSAVTYIVRTCLVLVFCFS
jgi:multidrug transporter EmrE-like cation transporter